MYPSDPYSDAVAAFVAGDLSGAEAKLDALVALSPLEPHAHLLLGMIAARRQRSDQAIQALRRALYLDESLALAHFWLGNLYRDRGDLERARCAYENVLHGWEHQTLDITRELLGGLSPEQLVALCGDRLHCVQGLQTDG